MLGAGTPAPNNPHDRFDALWRIAEGGVADVDDATLAQLRAEGMIGDENRLTDQGRLIVGAMVASAT